MKNILLVFVGSGCGGVLRYLISKYLKIAILGSFPLGTFFVNIVGCLLIGIFSGMFNSQAINQEIKTLLTVGFCGGFTTFSTFANDNFLSQKSGEMPMMILYLLASLIVGMLALWTGYKISQNI